MTWKQAKAEALRLVDDAARNRAELHLTEYQSLDRYMTEHPTGRTMGDHNLIVRGRCVKLHGAASTVIAAW
jgi:hypothetical protein